MTLRAALRDQAGHCTALGSPYTAEILTVVADNLRPGGAVADRLLGWPGDVSGRGASVPLRLAGALHSLVLTGADPALARAYAGKVTGAALWAAVDAALRDHEDHIMRWLDHAPQTNEVRRSAVLIAVGQRLAHRFGLPMVLSELGASAGLNLWWDRYALDLPGARFGPPDPVLTLTPDWRGPLPPPAAPVVAARAGVDLHPLDPVADRLRLMSYIWADQPDRMTRTEAALRAAPASHVVQADAATWLETRLAQPFAGHLHLIFHTIAWQYFPPATQARAGALIEAAGARATADGPLAWFGMEADASTPGAALTLRLWPGKVSLVLGRADFHGRWVDWQG